MKVVITGGHLTPALALIAKLEKENNIHILFIGRKHATEGSQTISQEYKIIKKRGIEFFSITAGRLQRKITIYTIPSLLKLPLGLIQSLIYLAKNKPDVVISFGSYVSTPTVIAASILKIPSITHEQALVPGLATRINARFAKKTLLTWKESKKYIESSTVIGNLTRATLFKTTTPSQKINLFLKRTNKLILVTGGNQGSHFLNRLIFESLHLLTGYDIIHQVGATNYKGDLDRAEQIIQDNYLALDYLEEDSFGPVISRADLVIGRSGANTVWDNAVLKKPAIYIPLQIAAYGEQKQIADMAKEAGVAFVIEQSEVTPKVLLSKIKNIFDNLEILNKSSEKFAKQLNLNAAEIILEEINKLSVND